MWQMLNLLFLIFSSYLMLNIVLYFYQDSFILYPPSKSSFSESIPQKHQIILEVNDFKLSGIQLIDDSDSKPLIIYFGGNAEDVSYNYFEFLQKLNANFVALNYRGYAGNPGKASLNEMLEDADVIIDEIMEKNNLDRRKVILMGRSLGSAFAIALAKKYKVGGIIAVSPFDSLANLGQKHFPFLPISLLLKKNFNNLQIAEDSEIPLLVISGGSDEIIPSAYSKKFFDAWKTSNKKFVIINTAGHNNIQNYNNYYQEINAFISSILLMDGEKSS